MASAEKFPHQNVLFGREEKKCTLPNGALSRRAGMGRPSIFSDKYWEAGIETDRGLWIILPAPSWHLPVWSIWATANQRYLNTQASSQMSPPIWNIERAGDENRLQTFRGLPTSPRFSPQPVYWDHLLARYQVKRCQILLHMQNFKICISIRVMYPSSKVLVEYRHSP